MSSYHITLTDDGSGNFTGLLRRGGTAASGGTALAPAAGNSMDMTVSNKDLGQIAVIALALAKDDRAAGN